MRASQQFLPVTVAARVTATVLLVLGLAGCGGKPGVTSLPLDRYPEAEYMVAAGTSSESMADAEASARAALAAQIRSRIRSQIRDEARQETRDQVTTYEATTVRTIDQDAAFDRMELFRIDPRSRRERDGLYRAVATMSRSEARRALRADYEAAGEQLDRAVLGLQAVPAGDLPAFAIRFGEVREAFALLDRRALQLRAVTGLLPADYRQQRDLWFAAERERQRRVSGLRLGLAVRPCIPAGDPLDSGVVRLEVLQALAGMGLTVRGEDCGDGYLLDLQPRLWHVGLTGVVTRLTFGGELRDCRTGDHWDVHLEHERWQAEGTRAEAATRAVAETVDEQTLRAALTDALGGHLPLR